MSYFFKNREFEKVLEPIRDLHANRMGVHLFAFLSDSYILKYTKEYLRKYPKYS